MKVGISLRVRFAILVIAAVIPLFGLSIVKAWIDADEAVQRAMNNLFVAASLAATSEEKAMQAAHQMLTAIAKTTDVRDGNLAACNRYLREIHDQFPGYLNLGVIGMDGHSLCNGVMPGRSEYLGDRAYFREAVARRTFVTGDYIIGRLTGKPAVTFAYPALDSKGAVAYVVFAALDLAEMSRAIAMVKLPPGASLGVHDRSGVLLAGTPNLPILPGQMVKSQVMLHAVRRMSGGVGKGPDSIGRERLWAFAPSGAAAEPAFLVVVSIDRDLVIGPSRRELLLELAALLLVAVSGFLMAWIMGGRLIVRPTAVILAATRKLQTGKLDVRVALPRSGVVHEFSSIADGVNRMADSLEQLQLSQERSFAELCETQSRLIGAERLGRTGNWIMDLTTRGLSWSEGMCRLYGLAPGEFDGKYETWLKMIHPEDRTVFESRLITALQDGSDLQTDYRIVTPDLDIRWLHQLEKLSVDAAGKPQFRTGVVQDITDRKRAEISQADSADKLRRTGAMARIGGWEVELDGSRLIASAELLRIYDMAPHETLTMLKAKEAFEPEVQQLVEAAMQAAIDQASSWDLELPMRTKTGRRIWVRTQGQALLKNGVAYRLVGALQDVTQQHESREHLHLLEKCIARLNDIVLITEAEPYGEPGGRIVFVNDAFECRTGYRREEVLGKSPRFLQGPKTQRAELARISAAVMSFQPVRAELINYTKTGAEFWVELDIVPISDAKGGCTHWVAVERDITQRKFAEQALVDSEQRYAALFDMAPIPMWVYDADSLAFLTVNRAAVQHYGYSVDEFLSMSILDLHTYVDAGQREEQRACARMIAGERWEHRTRNGDRFIVRPFSKPVQYGGQAARFVVALDISPQVKAESDVQEHLYSLQRAADAAQAITWHQTLSATLQEIADQARGVIGAHQAVVSLSDAGNWAEATHALSLSDKYTVYRDLLLPKDGVRMYEPASANKRAVRMTQAQLEAHPRWNSLENHVGQHPLTRGWLAVPMMGRSGQTIGLLQLSDKYDGDFSLQDEYVAMELAQLACIAIENTLLLEQVHELNAGLEQKVAERTVALVRQEALFRALSEQAPQVVWTMDPQGRATYFNRAWFDLMGGQMKDWEGESWRSAVHPEDVADVQASWLAATTGAGQFVGIRRLKAADGSYHTMSYRAAPVMDEHGKIAFWVGIDADVTEIKSIEAALRLSNQELEAFSYSVSHDLRSPLNTIEGFSRLLAKQLGSDVAGKSQHYLSRIQAGVAQMGVLIEDLLSLSQVSRMQLRYETIDLSALSRVILEEWRARQPERDVTARIEDGLKVDGDARLVRLVMENLLGNAWKFTSQKPGALIEVGQTPDIAGEPVFFVRDNGAGFDMAYADKLFVAFQRLHTVHEFPGTGIGLATCSRAIARHGGRLWAEAVPGKGASLFFTLPKPGIP